VIKHGFENASNEPWNSHLVMGAVIALSMWAVILVMLFCILFIPSIPKSKEEVMTIQWFWLILVAVTSFWSVLLISYYLVVGIVTVAEGKSYRNTYWLHVCGLIFIAFFTHLGVDSTIQVIVLWQNITCPWVVYCVAPIPLDISFALALPPSNRLSGEKKC
jgi:FtsH-binding integral membrane protein